MGDIGRIRKRIDAEPWPEDIPLAEPAPELEPAAEPVPETAPA